MLIRDRVLIGVEMIGFVDTETVFGVVEPGFDNVFTNNTFMGMPLLDVVSAWPVIGCSNFCVLKPNVG